MSVRSSGYVHVRMQGPANTTSETERASDEPRAAVGARRGGQRRRQGFSVHAARHAQRARRTWVSALFFPVFGIYLLVDAFRDVRDRLVRERRAVVQRRPSFRRPDEMGSLADRSMSDIVGAIERFPFRPARISTTHTFQRDNGADALGALLSPNPQITTIPHFYPPWFQQQLLSGDDGVPLAAMVAMHDRRAPALIISHGLLMTKNFDLIIRIARRAYEEWGFHVVTLDLRGWGQSAWTTQAPASAGYFEGRDIVEIARWLHRDPRVTSVGGLGYSLGGASMLNAAHVSSQADDRPMDGGIISVSGPTVIAEAVRHISTRPHWRDPFYGLFTLFDATIKAIRRRRQLDADVRTWSDVIERMALPYYDVTMEEFCQRASAALWADEIDQPVLHLHAEDDFVVPVQHAHALADRVDGNDWVHVMVQDAGAHVSFAGADSSWYHSVLRRWFEYWATPARESDPDDAPLD